MFGRLKNKLGKKTSGSQGRRTSTEQTSGQAQSSSSWTRQPLFHSAAPSAPAEVLAIGELATLGWNEHIQDSSQVDVMYKYERSIASYLLKAVADLYPLFSQRVAIALPDFTHGIATRFARYIGAIDTFNTRTGAMEETDAYTINLAVRPELMAFVTRWIITHGRSKGARLQKFIQHRGFGDEKLQAPQELAQHVCLIDQAPHDPSNAPGQDTNSKMDMLEAIEPLIISGPSGIGKSHIMLGAAAQLVALSNVVVVYIGDAGDLIVQPGSNEQFVSVIEHMACMFIEHKPVLDAITLWYKDTGMAQTNLKVKMRELLRSIRVYCETNDVTPVFFMDDYEKIVDVPSNDLVFDIRELSRTLKFMTVVSSSNANKMRRLAESAHQCIITSTPTFEDIDNIALSAHPSLEIAEEDLRRIANDLDYYPIDIIAALTRMSNYVERDKRVYADTAFHKIDKIQICINEQILERNSRISRLHSMFVEQCLDIELQQLGASDDKMKNIRAGKNNEVISTESEELRSEMLRIKRAVFMMYHCLEIKPGSRRDLQFMVPEYAANASNLTPIESRRYSMVCQPPAAREILYATYFRGTVFEQFQWTFKLCATKYDMEPSERVRFIDLSVLELGRLVASVKNLGTERMTTATFDFGRRVSSLADCISFGSAMKRAAKVIASIRDEKPKYLPSNNQTGRLSYSTMLHFPGLDFDEKWMDEEMRKTTHHQGSFMMALTRVDSFVDGVFTGCSIKVMWIVNDPIKIEVTPPSLNQGGQAGNVKNHDEMDQASRDREREYNTPQRDTHDNDQEFGYENSWAAKAFKIFKDIGQPAKFGNVDEVGMVAMAHTDRVDGIIQNKAKLGSAVSSDMSSFGLITIQTVNELSHTLIYV